MTEAKPLSAEELANVRKRHAFWSQGTPCDYRTAYSESNQHRARLITTIDAQAAEIARLTAERDELRAMVEKAGKDRDDYKRDYEMYARAWERELQPLNFVPKTHRIDALVLTTRKRVAQLMAVDTVLAEMLASMEAANIELVVTGVGPTIDKVTGWHTKLKAARLKL